MSRGCLVIQASKAQPELMTHKANQSVWLSITPPDAAHSSRQLMRILLIQSGPAISTHCPNAGSMLI